MEKCILAFGKQNDTEDCCMCITRPTWRYTGQLQFELGARHAGHAAGDRYEGEGQMVWTCVENKGNPDKQHLVEEGQQYNGWKMEKNRHGWARMRCEGSQRTLRRGESRPNVMDSLLDAKFNKLDTALNRKWNFTGSCCKERFGGGDFHSRVLYFRY